MIDRFFQYDDRQLIALMREQEHFCDEAFNVVFSRYSEKLKTYCYFQTNHKEESKELHQETWLKFYSTIKSISKEISLPAYLYKIARNLSIDKHRVQRNHIIIYDDSIDYEQIVSTGNFQADIENQELINLITLALSQLSEIYQETFILKWFSGLTYPEISLVLGETVDCIKQRSSRAFDMIINILNPIYMIVKYITDALEDLAYSRKFIIESLDKISYVECYHEGKSYPVLPVKLQEHQQKIIDRLGIKIM